jgi:hypothetical protein
MIVAGGDDRMTLNLKLQLTEDQLRRVRAAYGRGGKATRNECRVWLNRLVEAGLAGLPEPKLRRKPAPPEPKESKAAARRQAAVDAPDFALCEHCGHRKDEHGRMGFACPAPHRTTFVPDPDATREAQWEEKNTPFDDPNDLQDVEDEEAWAEYELATRAARKVGREEAGTLGGVLAALEGGAR